MERAVTSRASLAYFGSSIGGNDLKSSSATVATVKKVNNAEYKVSGTMRMVDIYGTTWTNNFDCTVESDDGGESWGVSGSFSYTSSNRRKS